MTHKCCCETYSGFCDAQQSLCVIHASQRGLGDMLFDANVPALVTHNRQDISSAFMDTQINEDVCDHKSTKTPERLSEVTA